MAGAITTTTQITFGSGSEGTDAHLSAEVDNRPSGLNAGKSSFVGGDPVYVLVYKSDNVSIISTLVSAGSVFPGPNQTVDVEEILTFANSRDASLSKPASGFVGVTWMGNSLGGISIGGNQTSVKASSSGVAVAKVTYKTQAKSYRISTPVIVNGSADFSILFFVAGIAS